MTTFDGANLLITLDAPIGGVLNVNVQANLYSEWKTWVSTGDNSKFPLAFRTTGGDPLTPGVQAGAYFFLQNQNNWRIISSDADQTINYNGNLVGEDGSIPLIVPTPGRSVLHLGLQPVTQRVDEILKSAQEAAYNGQVAINLSSLNSGTSFPIGTLSKPVNNLTDAFIIANNLGVKKFLIIGPATFDRDTTGYSILGGSAVDNDVLQLAGYSFESTRFEGCQLQGTMSGRSEAIQCGLHLLLGLDGFFRRCGLLGSMSSAANANITFDSCFSKEPGLVTPILSVGLNSSINLRNYSGGLELRNVTAGSVVSLDLDPGKVIIHPSCTGGTILVRGVGDCIDNSTGSVVTTDGLLDTVSLSTMIQSVIGNVDVSPDDLTITIRDPELNVLKVLSVSADGRTRRVL